MVRSRISLQLLIGLAAYFVINQAIFVKADCTNCSPDAYCDTPNNTCVCNIGFLGNGILCVNESAVVKPCEGKVCGENAHCILNRTSDGTPLGYCQCKEGFIGDGYNCTSERPMCPDEKRRCSVNAVCTFSLGKLECVCKSGFYGNGETCIDIDECTTLKPCNGANATCTNTAGSYECQCPVGYAGNGIKDCIDVDECLMGACGVENATCTNLPGSFRCDCPKGYKNIGKGGCRDGRMPCPYQNNTCSANAQCAYEVKTRAFKCSCNPGYTGNGNICEDIDECADKSNTCTANYGVCNNTDGGFTCTCPSGFTKDGPKSCKDIDECSAANPPCQDPNTICQNTIGSYTCQCRAGFFGDPSKGCSDVDECSNKTACEGDHVRCVNNLGSYECHCDIGFEKDGPKKCKDVNECQKAPCKDPRSGCENFPGSYICRCPPGEFYDENGKCKAVDKRIACPDDAHRCSLDAYCQVIGLTTTKCVCKTGYVGDGYNCTDKNECADNPTTCPGDGAMCTNTKGGFDCSCAAGFTADGPFRCTDVDECKANVSPCNGEKSTCTNTIGSFTCQCLPGYTGDGVHTCKVIDKRLPCPDDAHRCSLDANCVVEDQKLGNVSCMCKPGYSGDGYNCTDVDECELNPCKDSYATCTNLPGSFRCDCPKGTNSTEKGGCADGRTPCPDQNNFCSLNGQCSYDVSTKKFNCSCKPGYEGDGKTCQDIDECAKKSNTCTANNGICNNTVGGFTCTCPPGFTQDGFKGCKDIDECSAANPPCQGPNAVCQNTIGSYTCQCRAGFTGDHTKGCSDVDECLDKAACGGDHVTCLNNPGTYECRCGEGFENYGPRMCKDIDECQKAPCKDPSSTCENIPGSYVCHCPPGEVYDKQGKCKVVDKRIPCPDTAHRCSLNAYCQVIGQSMKCVCKTGYNGDGYRCTDIDECADNSTVCTGAGTTCTNTKGGFDCSCADGFTADGPFRCTDVDECKSDVSPCKGENSTCTNTIGSFNCQCPPGYTGDGVYSCKVIDKRVPCPDDSHRCSLDANCVVRDQERADMSCMCKPGYSGDGYNCTDVNECSFSPCKATYATCTNLPGSFSCDCPKGTDSTGSGDCLAGRTPCPDLNNLCSLDGGQCSYDVGTKNFSCSCKPGYKGDGKTCEDIDECANKSNTCQANNGVCNNTDGGFTCTCPSGFIQDGSKGCKDINECSAPNPPCQGTNTVCLNNLGSYTCQCPTGFTGNSTTGCIDVDECLGQTPCEGDNVTCLNNPGAYECHCDEGFENYGPRKCKDVDECQKGFCKDPSSTCKNIPGGYICHCPPGEVYTKEGICKPKDKRILCPDDAHRCSLDAECQVIGLTTTKCVCKPGYVGDGYNCFDIDECADNPTICPGDGAMCTNTKGGFNCSCAAGFTADGHFRCNDIDECTANVSLCNGENSTCTNTIGSFTCQCLPGYTGDGVNTCKVIDNRIPCPDDAHRCSLDAQCDVNELTDMKCVCKTGYSGDGYNCKDENECHADPPPCSGVNTTCTNTEGSYTCSCALGFTADGPFSCVDLDECKQKPSPCQGINATCTNTDGSFTCSCPTGFTGDGVTSCAELTTTSQPSIAVTTLKQTTTSQTTTVPTSPTTTVTTTTAIPEYESTVSVSVPLQTSSTDPAALAIYREAVAQTLEQYYGQSNESIKIINATCESANQSNVDFTCIIRFQKRPSIRPKRQIRLNLADLLKKKLKENVAKLASNTNVTVNVAVNITNDQINQTSQINKVTTTSTSTTTASTTTASATSSPATSSTEPPTSTPAGKSSSI